MNDHPGYATGEQCVDAANMVRLRAGAPLIKKTNDAASRLYRVPKIQVGTNGKPSYLYHLKTAIAALSKVRNNKAGQVHRKATIAELKSGRLIPLVEGCKLFNTNHARLRCQISHLNIFAVEHPVTNALLVDWRQLIEKCCFRSLKWIRKHTTRDQYLHIVSSRPYIKYTHFAHHTSKSYFVPELSHIGSKNTAVCKKRRGTYPEPLKQEKQ